MVDAIRILWEMYRSNKYTVSQECAISEGATALENKEKYKQEGRVEGMKQELKDTLTTLKAIDNILDSYESAQSLKLLIKVKEKRLKELEKKVLKNEFCN